MQLKNLKKAAIAIALPSLAMAAPSMATPMAHLQFQPAHIVQTIAKDEGTTFEHKRKRGRNWNNDRGYDRYESRGRGYDRGYDQPVYRDTRIWRGGDGRYYCRKEDGTTGLIIGAAVGGIIGNEVAGRGDKTLGAILGAAGGAILGRSIDRSNSRCR